jgi:hypothetical protein
MKKNQPLNLPNQILITQLFPLILSFPHIGYRLVILLTYMHVELHV